jgi:hypothetical protein
METHRSSKTTFCRELVLWTRIEIVWQTCCVVWIIYIRVLMSQFMYKYWCNIIRFVLRNQLAGEMSEECKSTKGIFCQKDSN